MKTRNWLQTSLIVESSRGFCGALKLVFSSLQTHEFASGPKVPIDEN